jgi:cell wall-associated NlpC family hydrolase
MKILKVIGIAFISLLSLPSWTEHSFAYSVKSVVADTSDGNDSLRAELKCKMEDDSVARVSLIDSVVNYSKNFIGYHYKYGSNGQNKSFDCSHFVSYCYKHYGVNIPCSSAGLVTMGEKIDISEVRAGDLMFFKGRNSKSTKVGHVSLVIENNNGHIKLIHATSRGVIIDEYDKASYYKERFIMARRLNIGK